MRRLLGFIVLILISVTSSPLVSWAQTDSLLDVRNGKWYRIKAIASTTWMLDNLDYEANQSTGLSDEQKNEFRKFNFHGRYYHFQYIDSVCPPDWRLPNVQDWTSYFRFLVENDSRKVDLHIVDQIDPEDKNHYTSFLNYSREN